MATRLADDPIIDTPHGRAVAETDRRSTPALSVGGDGVEHADLAEAVADIGERFGDLLASWISSPRWPASCASRPGVGPILGIMAFRRRPDLTHDQFIEY